MKVNRTIKIETDTFKVGDKIKFKLTDDKKDTGYGGKAGRG